MTAGLLLLGIVTGLLLIGLGVWWYGPNGPEANYDDQEEEGTP